jgi:hypothetical protein
MVKIIELLGSTVVGIEAIDSYDGYALSEQRLREM